MAIWVLGQVRPAVPVLVAAHDGTVDLEVVEVLGIDGPDDPGVPDLHQVVDHGRGRVRSVVPTLEGGDHDGIDQVRGFLDLDHPVQPSHGPGFRPAPREVSRSEKTVHHVDIGS